MTTARARTAVLLGIALLAVPGAALALRAPEVLQELPDAEREALETLATYPEPLRDAALEASLHVDVLVETQRIQEASSAAFEARIAELDAALQRRVWELVREPGLLTELATGGPPTPDELESIAGRHDAALGPAIRELGSAHHALLAEILEIHRRARERFEASIAGLPEATRQALQSLIEQPELLSLLTRRVRLTVRLGDSYREHPDETRAWLADLATQVAARNAEAAAAWETIASDAEASGELEDAARAYADEHGYDYGELTHTDVPTRVHVVVHPYPFWFGFPLWYADAHLYPYGYWYPYVPHVGYFHHHHFHHRVHFALPSPHFLHWFFADRHHHHRHYPRFTRWLGGYHDRHRHARSHFHRTVRHAVQRRPHGGELADVSAGPRPGPAAHRGRRDRHPGRDRAPGFIARPRPLDPPAARDGDRRRFRERRDGHRPRARIDPPDRLEREAPPRERVKPRDRDRDRLRPRRDRESPPRVRGNERDRDRDRARPRRDRESPPRVRGNERDRDRDRARPRRDRESRPRVRVNVREKNRDARRDREPRRRVRVNVRDGGRDRDRVDRRRSDGGRDRDRVDRRRSDGGRRAVGPGGQRRSRDLGGDRGVGPSRRKAGGPRMERARGPRGGSSARGGGRGGGRGRGGGKGRGR